MKRLLLLVLAVVFAFSVIAQAQLITIDGEKDAWYDGLTGPADGMICLPHNAFMSDIGDGLGPEGGDEDCSAIVWFGWDESYLYCYAEIKDDLLLTNNATQWQNDGMELKIDPDPSVGAATGTASSHLTCYGVDDAQDPSGVADLTRDADLLNVDEEAFVGVEGEDFVREETDDGYDLEYRIPWEYVGEPADGRFATAEVGEIFGMAINVADNDETQREDMLCWAAVASDLVWNQPPLHGTVTFLADNKLNFEAVNAIDPTNVNDSADVWYSCGAGGCPTISITIDGEKDAWYDGLTGPADGLICLPHNAFMSDIGDGLGPEGGDEDCSAIVWFGWDETYLYCYTEIKDDLLLTNNATQWQNDGMELKIDPDPSVGAATGTASSHLTCYGVDDAQDPSGVADLTRDADLLNVDEEAFVGVEGEDFVREETDDGYDLEYRIPWEYVGEPADGRFATAEVGEIFGMAINVADNDETQREDMLCWAAVASDLVWNQPPLHGTVTFLDCNKLKFEAVNAIDPTNVNDSADVWYTACLDVDKIQTGFKAQSFSLEANYPNPFNPETKIRYNLERTEQVTLAIYSITGELVRSMVSSQVHNPGSYELIWDSRNNNGELVTSGVYFYRISTPSLTETRKMTLMR